jgi:hypothetical protein
MDYYINDIKINFNKIVDLYVSESKNRWFLNIKTGKNRKNLTKETWSEDYFEIPKISKGNRYRILEEYAKEGMEEEKIANQILTFLKNKNYDDAFKLLKTTDDYKYYGYQTWRDLDIGEDVWDWLDSLPVKFEEKWDYDCNCLACMAMQKADEEDRELNASKLINAMEKQNYINFINKTEEK